jgi:ubiquitin-protein ligase E3 C
MYNEAGALEMGIDGGGVFREFLTELLKSSVNPIRGLFQSTAHNSLYPNPKALSNVEYMREQFHFFGRMLGKVIIFQKG